MNDDAVVVKLRRQILLYRVVLGCLSLIVALWYIHVRIGGSKALVLVNGKPVACVANEREAHALLRELKAKAGGDLDEIQFREDVVIARAPRDAKPVSRHRAENAIRSAISLALPRWAIICDGKPVVALPSRTAAGETLELAKAKFGRLAKNLCEEPQFKEKVTVDIALVPPAMCKKTPEEAVRFLFDSETTHREEGFYTVKQGDTASRIAKVFGLSVRDLWSLNPGVNLNRLQIGDKIKVQRTVPPKPKLTVVVRDQSEKLEKIPPPVHRVSSARMYLGKSAELSPGSPGLRRVKVATVYENGRQVGIEVLEEEILKEPVPRRIVEGIKPRL
ncbi:MAG: G5 domain-containing protein [Armatimonadota bacterium]|nr:G5 domain-containing protein [Armatimonadota bacterium]